MLTAALALPAAFMGAAGRAEEAPKKSSEPRIATIYPLSGKAGTHWEAAVRGLSLAGAYAVRFETEGLNAEVLSVEPEPPGAAQPADLVRLRMSAESRVAAGKHEFRIVTPRGISNAIALRLVEQPIFDESAAASALRSFPVALNGRLSRRGEVDSFWIETAAGQELTLQAWSGHAQFDPSLELMQQSATYFDPKRMIRVAFNDEPLYFPELNTDARLVHRFEKGGKYCVRVAAFTGMGGPDFVYTLRVAPGAQPAPHLHPQSTSDWDERLFTRKLSNDWMGLLAARSGKAEKMRSPETYRAAIEGAPDIPVMALPGVVEGRIAQPGEAHQILFQIDKAQLLAIEVETPESTMPLFNPVVRLLDDAGREMVGTVYTKRNNNGLYMMKMIQAKLTFDLRAPGKYRLQIRDITTDRAGKSFAYRVLVRPQIPHLGKITVAEDRINLAVGESKPVTVKLEREEGYAGTAVVTVEDLPPGVTVLPAAENEIERPALPNAGRPERYSPKLQTRAVLLAAANEAEPMRMPVEAKVVVRPVVDGKMMAPIAIKRLPVMVVSRAAQADPAASQAVTTK